jgi:DNA-directed RNA polymerase II subunit RPB2
MDIKSANYEKLNNKGLISIGTYIEKGDAIIGKYITLPKATAEKWLYADHSVIYKEEEPAIVHNVIESHNEDDERFIKVILRKVRPMIIGDKVSARSGQKGICALIMKDSDMPFTKDGMRPSILFNPHGLPSRMTIGQLLESMTGNLCAAKGCTTDATVFRSIDVESMASELESYGYNRYGYQRLYNGITGEFIDSLIFMGPTYYQKLQKFVLDTLYSISSGPTDALTHQMLEGGKGNSGGLRIGEMEKDVLVSHGTSRFLNEKFFGHSDGFTEYICSCGRPAIFNQQKNIYKCKYCLDNAQIAAVPTSWSSKLFMQELDSMGIGVKRMLTPYVYEKQEE